MMTQVANN